MTVEGWHTYHVGELDRWVDNVCIDGIPFFDPGRLKPHRTDAPLDTLGHVKNGTVPTGPTATRWSDSFGNVERRLPVEIDGRSVNYTEYRVDARAFDQDRGGTHHIVVGETSTGQHDFYTTTLYGTDGTARRAFWRIR